MLPFEDQVLFDHKTGTFAVGYHTITTNLPVCATDPSIVSHFQADLLRGTNPATAAGTPDFATEPGRLMDWKFDGQDCPEPVTPVTPTPEKPVVTPTTNLPNTGAGAIVAQASLVGLAAGVIHARKVRAKANQ
jgi:hypothetical protein